MGLKKSKWKALQKADSCTRPAKLLALSSLSLCEILRDPSRSYLVSRYPVNNLKDSKDNKSSKTVQDSARQCKTMQDNARHNEVLFDMFGSDLTSAGHPSSPSQRRTEAQLHTSGL